MAVKTPRTIGPEDSREAAVNLLNTANNKSVISEIELDPFDDINDDEDGPEQDGDGEPHETEEDKEEEMETAENEEARKAEASQRRPEEAEEERRAKEASRGDQDEPET